MNNEGGAPRYALILETVSGDKYYYDINYCTFFRMGKKTKPCKTTLEALDVLTTNFDSPQQLVDLYGIKDPIKRLLISYKHIDEKVLAPVFNNEKWGLLAKNYAQAPIIRRGSKKTTKKIDFRMYNSKSMLDDVYKELCNLKIVYDEHGVPYHISEFGSYLLKNQYSLINLSPDTRNVIENIVAHEAAILTKRRDLSSQNAYYGKLSNTLNGFAEFTSLGSCLMPDIYSEHRLGYYEDFKACCSKYREFRTLYLNYCKFKRMQEVKELQQQENESVVVEEKKVPQEVQPVQEVQEQTDEFALVEAVPKQNRKKVYTVSPGQLTFLK